MEKTEVVQDTVVFDLDGTIALNDHRSHFLEKTPKDWTGYYKACVDDLPNHAVIASMAAHALAGHKLVIMSGRGQEAKQETTDWLDKHVYPHLPEGTKIKILMRPVGMITSDVTLKSGWLKKGWVNPQAIICVYEDRDSVVKMWRDLGIACFQVAPGNF